MAYTAVASSNALTKKLWAKELFVDALKKTIAPALIGKSADSGIQRRDETSKGKGDAVTVGLRMQLSGAGVLGEGEPLEGSEEALTLYSDSLTLNQLSHQVILNGKLTEQRTEFDLRQEAKDGLSDWFADRIDTAAFNQLCGNTAQTDLRYTGGVATTAPTSGRQIWNESGVSADQSLTSAGTFSLAAIDRAITAAKVSSPYMRPLMINGRKKYVAVLHPYQVYSLRTSTTTGQWLDIQKAAMMGGQISGNPIYDRALGEYHDTILWEDSRIPLGCNGSTPTTAVANTRRAVFIGAQAGLIAFGQETKDAEKFTLVEKLFNYDTQYGVSAQLIFAMKKTQFNSADFGTIVMSSYAAAP